MSCHSRGLAVGCHDDCFLIVDRVGQDFVVGVRAHTGEVSTRPAEFWSRFREHDEIAEIIYADFGNEVLGQQ